MLPLSLINLDLLTKISGDVLRSLCEVIITMCVEAVHIQGMTSLCAVQPDRVRELLQENITDCKTRRFLLTKLPRK